MENGVFSWGVGLAASPAASEHLLGLLKQGSQESIYCNNLSIY